MVKDVLEVGSWNSNWLCSLILIRLNMEKLATLEIASCHHVARSIAKRRAEHTLRCTAIDDEAHLGYSGTTRSCRWVMRVVKLEQSAKADHADHASSSKPAAVIQNCCIASASEHAYTAVAEHSGCPGTDEPVRAPPLKATRNSRQNSRPVRANRRITHAVRVCSAVRKQGRSFRIQPQPPSMCPMNPCCSLKKGSSSVTVIVHWCGISRPENERTRRRLVLKGSVQKDWWLRRRTCRRFRSRCPDSCEGVTGADCQLFEQVVGTELRLQGIVIGGSRCYCGGAGCLDCSLRGR